MRKSSFFISVAAVMALATPACAASVKAAKGNTKQMAKHMALQREVGLRSITEDAARAHVYFLADDLRGNCTSHIASNLKHSSLAKNPFVCNQKYI